MPEYTPMNQAYASLAGVGHYLPARVVTNEELAPRIGSTPEWIASRIGIQSRHWAAHNESNSNMAAHAAKAAIASAGLETKDIDAIIYATLSPNVGFPGSGVFLQRELGMAGIPALDVRNQCSGFLYGLSVANAWIRCETYKNVLLVGSELHSTGLEMAERGRAVSAMFGDGAGAVVLTRSSTLGVIDVRLGADGTGIESLWCELPSSSNSPIFDPAYLREGRQFPKMNGRTVMRKAVEILSRFLAEMMTEYDIDPENIVYVPHQSNVHICNMVAKRLGIPKDHVVSTISTHGNITAASIPAALSVAIERADVVEGSTILMGAFGSGYTWGGALVKY